MKELLINIKNWSICVHQFENALQSIVKFRPFGWVFGAGNLPPKFLLKIPHGNLNFLKYYPNEAFDKCLLQIPAPNTLPKHKLSQLLLFKQKKKKKPKKEFDQYHFLVSNLLKFQVLFLEYLLSALKFKYTAIVVCTVYSSFESTNKSFNFIEISSLSIFHTFLFLGGLQPL